MSDPIPTSFERGVFVNVPFDDGYATFFRALLFAIIDSGYQPRCSRERVESTHNRLKKLSRLIVGSRFAIHDLSRDSFAGDKLPRFNMPIELGIEYGCKKFGPRSATDVMSHLRTKERLILVRQEYDYHLFASDLLGLDPTPYFEDPFRLLDAVATWLRGFDPLVPDSYLLWDRHQFFEKVWLSSYVETLMRKRGLAPIVPAALPYTSLKDFVHKYCAIFRLDSWDDPSERQRRSRIKAKVAERGTS